MCPAGDLGDAAAVEPVVSGIGIGLEKAAKAGKMGQRMRGGAVGREAIPGCTRCRAAGCPVVGRVDPQPPGRGLAPAGVEHRHGRVIGMDLIGLEQLVTDAADDGVEECCGLSGPARQRRAVDVEPLRRHHLGLAVQRQMMVELRDDDVRQCRERGLAACHGADRCRRLDDLLAHPAAVFRADVTHDPPAHRHDVEHLVRVDTQRAQRTTAIRAGAGARCRFVDDLLARQVPRQTADGHRPRRYAGRSDIDHRSVTLRLQLFQRQFELLDLASQLLGRGAELHPPQSGDLAAQGIDEQVAGGKCRIRPGERGLQRSDPRGGISRGNRRFRHPDFIAECMATGEQNRRKTAVLSQPASA